MSDNTIEKDTKLNNFDEQLGNKIFEAMEIGINHLDLLLESGSASAIENELVKTPSALERAEFEEQSRRYRSSKEIVTLEGIIKNTPLPFEQEDLLKLFSSDMKRISELNADLKSSGLKIHPALSSNKITEILNCSMQIVSHNYDSIHFGSLLETFPIDSSERTILGGVKNENGSIINYFDTSIPNCIQNIYLGALRLETGSHSILQIAKLKQLNIYQVEASPNIHTTKLPDRFDSGFYREWFYFYQDQKSPVQGELLVPTLGYAFGGSRAEERYGDKYFKSEDCSSALAKWLGAKQPFITANMKAFYDEYFQDPTTPKCVADIYCSAVREVLTPLNISAVEARAGQIFFFPGHTGIVTGNFPEEGLIETLSYARNMPEVEGLGYLNYTYSAKAFLFFAETKLVAEEMAFTTPYDEL